MLAYKHIPDAKIVAVSDIDLDRAEAFARKHGVERAYRDHVEVSETKDLDYVDVCTPVSTHASITCDVAESGHSILLEKPMARTVSDCDRMIHEIQKHGVKLCVCHNQLYIPQVMQVKAKVDSGEFDLLSLRVSVKESAELIGAPNWIMTPEEGGVLWETGCHTAYLQLHFLKGVDRVFAVGSRVKHPVHDQFTVLLQTPENTFGITEVSWLAKRPERIFELSSSDGRRIQILDYNYLQEIPEKTPRGLVSGFYSDQRMIMKKWMTTTLDSIRKGDMGYCLPHHTLISKYIEALRVDSEVPVKPEEGKRAVNLLECIERSLNQKRSIEIENAS